MPVKKEKIKHTLKELKEMIELFKKHIEELEVEIEENNARPS
jgi:hypothetical protein